MKAYKIIAIFTFWCALSIGYEYTFCLELLQGIENGPEAPPIAPPQRREKTTPKQPPVKPERDPQPGPLVPVPFPGRKPVPTHDPKDIVPLDLYQKDALVKPFWDRIPFGLRRKMVEAWGKEEAEINQFIKEKFNAKPAKILSRVKELESEISKVESKHKEKILNVIQQMLEARYGKKNSSKIQFDIGKNYPTRIEPTQQNESPYSAPVSAEKGIVSKFKSFFTKAPVPVVSSEAQDHNGHWSNEMRDFFIYRRELYNLLQQGAGWTSMREFAVSYADELNAIEPGLAEKYEELHKLYRWAYAGLLSSVRHPEKLRGDSFRNQATHGREVVDAQYGLKENPDGTQFLYLKGINAQAVGYNGWAAAHEASKAGFQVATPNEASQRSQLTGIEREELDNATNSNLAEIRQGIYGHSVDMLLRTRLNQLVSYPLKAKQYYTLIDRIFYALPPKQFYHFWNSISDPHFNKNPQKVVELKEMLQTFQILDGLPNG